MGSQTIVVILLVAAAIVYLALSLRSSRGRGGCGGCHKTPPLEKGEHGGVVPEPAKDKSNAVAFFPAENLAEIARRRREERGPS